MLEGMNYYINKSPDKTIKEIDLKNSYRVILKIGRYKKQLIQYIEANTMDEAIKKAKNTFYGRRYLLCGKGSISSLTEKACELKLLKGKYKFHFENGWLSFDVSGLNIFEGLQKLKNNKRFIEFSENALITEIEKEYIID